MLEYVSNVVDRATRMTVGLFFGLLLLPFAPVLLFLWLISKLENRGIK